MLKLIDILDKSPVIIDVQSHIHYVLYVFLCVPLTELILAKANITDVNIKCIHTYRDFSRQTDRQTDRQTGRQEGRQTYMYRQTDRQTNKQKDRQTHIVFIQT